jgi:hypothetical protein
MPHTNHVFVDYQNMREVDANLFAIENATITLLLGKDNHSLDVATVEQLMAKASAVELVRIEKHGKDAVDFALAYYLGRKAMTDPTAFFHIVSKDKGYDPLIQHLRARRVRVNRHENFAAVFNALKPSKPVATPGPKTPKTKQTPALLARVAQ